MVIFHSYVNVYQRIFVVSPLVPPLSMGWMAGTEVQGEKLAPEAKARHLISYTILNIFSNRIYLILYHYIIHRNAFLFKIILHHVSSSYSIMVEKSDFVKNFWLMASVFAISMDRSQRQACGEIFPREDQKHIRNTYLKDYYKVVPQFVS